LSQSYDILALVETGRPLAADGIWRLRKVTGNDEVEERAAAENELAKLEQALVEAHYLGLSLRALAANRNFRYAAITASVCELLIGWARFVGDRLQEGERPFLAGPVARPHTHPRARSRKA
jgi:hypothetical protein